MSLKRMRNGVVEEEDWPLLETLCLQRGKKWNRGKKVASVGFSNGNSTMLI